MKKDLHLQKIVGKGLTLAKVKQIVKQIDEDSAIISEATKMLFDTDHHKSMRAGWLLVHASPSHPQLVKKQLPAVFKCLKQVKLDHGTTRECLQLFQIHGVPKRYSAQLFDICITNAKNGLLPHAVRAFSLNLLSIICQTYPDLSPEVMLVLNELESFPQPPSVAHCVKKAKKLISSL